MIRGVLTRKTPLRRTGPIKRRARPVADRVRPNERSIVINRDRMCFLYRMDPGHRCTNAFTDAHSPFDLLALTVDHFWHAKGGRKGDRAPSDRYHMVAMCHGGNVAAPSGEVRDAERSYIRVKYPEWVVTDDFTEPSE